MQSPVQAKLFSIENCDFSIDDFIKVLANFELLAEWQKKVGQGRAAESLADSREQSINTAKISAWSRDFRYDNDLLNVAELDDWLSDQYLTKEDLESFLVRRYWREELSEDLQGEMPEVSDIEVYREIVLSSSFETLKASWQKRLLAWFENHDGLFDDFKALEGNYQKYCGELAVDCDLGAWLTVLAAELNVFELELYSAEKEIFELAGEPFRFRGFYKDLPAVVQKATPYLGVGEVEGPFLDGGEYIWVKLVERHSFETERDEAETYALECFQDEVWKTLAAKYIDE